MPKLLYLHIRYVNINNVSDGSSELIIWLLTHLVKYVHRIHMFGIAYRRLDYDSKFKYWITTKWSLIISDNQAFQGL